MDKEYHIHIHLKFELNMVIRLVIRCATSLFIYEIYFFILVNYNSHDTVCRLSTEPSPSHQNVVTVQKRNSNENLFQQSSSKPAEPSEDSIQHSLR